MIASMVSALLLSLAACGSVTSVDDTPNPNITSSEEPTGAVATLYTTTADRAMTLTKAYSAIGNEVNMAPTTIQIDPTKTYQQMDGFGFAITYSTCYNLLKMDQEARAKFLKQTYSETEGYGVSYARISIGCND
ncbi:MAG: glucosylceramidase, partial [Prevotella sp.]|nr:glucosylceramidase [Prevotella sp.]